jgi:hypothetical protein
MNGGGRVFPLSRAALAEWHEVGLDTRKGTVLELGGRLRLGVRETWASTALHPTAAPIHYVDLVVAPDVFDAVLAATNLRLPGDAAPLLGCSIRGTVLPLVRNITSPGALFRTAGQTLAILLGVGCAGGLIAQAVSGASLVANAARGFVLLAIAVGSTLLPLLAWRRSRSSTLALELAEDQVRLVDTRDGTEQAAGRDLSVAPAVYAPPWWAEGRGSSRWYMIRRYGVYAYPVLLLRWSNGRAISVGVRDFSIGWNIPAAKSGAPRYLIGKGDWRKLNDVLRLRGSVVEKDPPGAIE